MGFLYRIKRLGLWSWKYINKFRSKNSSYLAYSYAVYLK